MSEHITNFIRKRIDNDIATGKNQGKVITRFPPEPNGYLHIGHAKAICLNFGLAQDYTPHVCHLRMDDTNPLKEEDQYIHAIQRDIKWLGFDWGEHLYFASDYYDTLYENALALIKAGNAFVCSLNAEQMREYRGTLTEPGKNSPDRDRSVEDNLDLFTRMKAGEFDEGEYTLRAKIDMSADNMNLRDPVIYRIRKAHHHRTKDAWCIYPMYDYAHALSDAIEGITHSLCTLEFQDHRPLYDWCVANSDLKAKPQQIEFSRLQFNYTITSKRKLKALVDANVVSGWDDPRMPTLSGMRRRGYPAAAIRKCCDHVGISKTDSIIDFSILEQHVRDELNHSAQRRMAVLNPIKVIITNYPEDKTEMLSASNHPQQPDWGRRPLPFSRELYIDADDFAQTPPPKFHRLTLNKDVRLLNAYVIHCDDIIHNEDSSIKALHCTYLPETIGGKKPADGHKVKGTIHWVSATHAKEITVRLYDRLFQHEKPASLDNIMDAINPNSLTTITAFAEPSIVEAKPQETFQFNRIGYFCADSEDSKPNQPVFNRVVGLRDTWQQA